MWAAPGVVFPSLVPLSAIGINGTRYIGGLPLEDHDT